MKKIVTIKPVFYLIFILSLLLVSGNRVEATNEKFDFDKQQITFTLKEKSASKEKDETTKKQGYGVLPRTGEKTLKGLIVLGVTALLFSIIMLIMRKRLRYEK